MPLSSRSCSFSTCSLATQQKRGVGVFVSSHIHKHIQFVKAADDASYLWLKLEDVCLVTLKCTLRYSYATEKGFYAQPEDNTCYTVPI